MRVTFPWGSLLRGVLGTNGNSLAGIARVAKPGAEVRALFSMTERDGLDVAAVIDRAAYEANGMCVVEERDATAGEIAAMGSSWAKRLRAGVERPVTLLRAVRVER